MTSALLPEPVRWRPNGGASRFRMSCDPSTGRLLAVLAAAVPVPVDGERLWREDRITALLSSAPDELPGTLFIQARPATRSLLPRFHHIVLLSAPPEIWPNGWPRAPLTPTGKRPPSSPRRSSTSRQWNRCYGPAPRSKWSPRFPSRGSPTSSSTTSGRGCAVVCVALMYLTLRRVILGSVTQTRMPDGSWC